MGATLLPHQDAPPRVRFPGFAEFGAYPHTNNLLQELHRATLRNQPHPPSPPIGASSSPFSKANCYSVTFCGGVLEITTRATTATTVAACKSSRNHALDLARKRAAATVVAVVARVVISNRCPFSLLLEEINHQAPSEARERCYSHWEL